MYLFLLIGWPCFIWRIRMAGIKGLQGVVRKTVNDELQANIWDPQHMDKIVPSLLFNLQSGERTERWIQKSAFLSICCHLLCCRSLRNLLSKQVLEFLLGITFVLWSIFSNSIAISRHPAFLYPVSSVSEEAVVFTTLSWLRRPDVLSVDNTMLTCCVLGA